MRRSAAQLGLLNGAMLTVNGVLDHSESNQMPASSTHGGYYIILDGFARAHCPGQDSGVRIEECDHTYDDGRSHASRFSLPSLLEHRFLIRQRASSIYFDHERGRQRCWVACL